MEKKLSDIPEAIELKQKISEWKKSKTTVAMPEDLWVRAAQLSKGFPPYSAAVFFDIHYAGLVKRLPPRKIKSRTEKKYSKFIELPQFEHLSSDTKGLEFSFMNEQGQKATVRGMGTSKDWANVFSGWLQASN